MQVLWLGLLRWLQCMGWRAHTRWHLRFSQWFHWPVCFLFSKLKNFRMRKGAIDLCFANCARIFMSLRILFRNAQNSGFSPVVFWSKSSMVKFWAFFFKYMRWLIMPLALALSFWNHWFSYECVTILSGYFMGGDVYVGFVLKINGLVRGDFSIVININNGKTAPAICFKFS